MPPRPAISASDSDAMPPLPAISVEIFAVCRRWSLPASQSASFARSGAVGQVAGAAGAGLRSASHERAFDRSEDGI
jgi:hypothetical protein